MKRWGIGEDSDRKTENKNVSNHLTKIFMNNLKTNHLLSKKRNSKCSPKNIDIMKLCSFPQP